VKSRGSRRRCLRGLATESEDFEGSGRTLKEFMRNALTSDLWYLFHEESCLRCGMWMPSLQGSVSFLSAVEKVVFCLSLLPSFGIIANFLNDTVRLTERSRYFCTWGVERSHFEAHVSFHATSNPAKPSRHPSFTSALTL
jgi:hypothetical protein